MGGNVSDVIPVFLNAPAPISSNEDGKVISHISRSHPSNALSPIAVSADGVSKVIDEM